ncbi:GlxA family transcriptional regulator [Nocardioides nitrophenolicus]|uniref:GlxA family transcriptional regulator n=1 Tax=Nocardioides nitrophenolicus TaxID=60489 RepID=UPI00195816CA|nr:helix-turn-helix domain-containing protein [Nocardioides nitrophenolicus]MBM7519990.1 AraC family transcriptional activator FtrA [Nocardioides nitrophenolicus]
MSSRRSIAVPVVDGMTLFEIGMPLEALGYDWDRDASPLYDVALHGDLRGVRVHGGSRLAPHRPLAALAEADTVLVPAIRPDEPVDPALVRALRRAAAAGARMVSLCSGAFALAEAGVLDGHRATTHWRWADLLQRRYPAVEVDARAIYVDDGVLTSAGSAAGLDLCLHLIRTDHGQQAANTIARNLVIAAHRDGDQAQYVAAEPLTEQAHWLDELRAWVHAHLHEDITLDRLAAAAAASPRTLARRFHRDVGTTPMRWVAAERIAIAKRLLETTELSLDRIGHDAGYVSPATFRASFIAEVGVTPGRYRLRFAG